jgi:hypothetical protein
MYLTIVLLAVFFACVAMMFNEGLWNNAIAFFNVMTAALLATNYFEPLATWLDRQQPTYTYVWDFLALWAVFAAVLVVLRLATDTISHVKVRFKMPVEMIGGIFFALWIGWIMVCFTTFSLHMAPLARNSFGGAFQETPESEMFFGLAPDRKWLAFVHTMSDDGSLARGEKNVFDPQTDFILRYGARRAAFEKVEDIRVRK